MAQRYIAINRGAPGVKATDFTFGTSSSAASDIELRMADNVNLTRKDVFLALEAFERVLTSGKTYTTFPPL